MIEVVLSRIIQGGLSGIGIGFIFIAILLLGISYQEITDLGSIKLKIKISPLKENVLNI